MLICVMQMPDNSCLMKTALCFMRNQKSQNNHHKASKTYGRVNKGGPQKCDEIHYAGIITGKDGSD